MSRQKPWIWFFTALVAAVQSSNAPAQLGLFQTEVQAQQHCPNDTVVWLDPRKRVFYVAGQRLYARGRTGTFACQKEARRNGSRRSLFGLR